MARPRKDQQLAFYDEFYAMTPEDQSFALRVLNEHHRYVLSQRKPRKEPEPAAEQQELMTAAP